MNKTACVFGSTGLIGTYLTDCLIADNRYQKILVFNRKKLTIEHPKIEQVVGDYSNLLAYKEQLKADEYYCCLGTTMHKAKTKPAFEYVDYQLPLEIGNLALSNEVKHYLVISSIGAASKSNNFYLRTKGGMEEALIHLGIDNLFIFRPSMLLGKRNETRILEIISKPFLVAFGYLLFGKLKRYRAIHGKTVAKAMIYAANSISNKQIIESDEITLMVKK